MNKLIKFIFIFFLLNTLNLSNSFADISKVDEITKNLRCLICQGQSIYDSNSDFALSVKTLVFEKKSSESIEMFVFQKISRLAILFLFFLKLLLKLLF